MTMTRQFLLMVFASVLLGLGARVAQKSPVPFWGFPKPIQLIQPAMAIAGAASVSPDSAFVPADQPYSVDFSTAMGLYMKRKKANVHFLDARDAKQYAEGHISGAVNIPFERVAEFDAEIDKMPKPDLYVLYCDGGDCHLSHDLSEYMLNKGFKRLAVYVGGWVEWSKEASDFIETP